MIRSSPAPPLDGGEEERLVVRHDPRHRQPRRIEGVRIVAERQQYAVESGLDVRHPADGGDPRRAAARAALAGDDGGGRVDKDVALGIGPGDGQLIRLATAGLEADAIEDAGDGILLRSDADRRRPGHGGSGEGAQQDGEGRGQPPPLDRPAFAAPTRRHRRIVVSNAVSAGRRVSILSAP